MKTKGFFAYLNKPPKHKFTCEGRNDIPQYGFTVIDTGEEVLTVKSYSDAQAIINSCHDDVCLSKIIDRFMSGDEKALSKMEKLAFYDDISEMPSTMHEMHTAIVNAREDFNSMSYEDRAVFNNDFNQFMSALGTDKFFNWVNSKSDSIEDVVEKVESEVVADE